MPTRSRAWRIGSRGCISVHTTFARVERGESLERVAEVGSVEDRNQALAAERADVSRLEQALQHADYAREYWERSRKEQIARERDDRGWSRS